MAAERNLGILNAILKISFTIVSGILRIAIQLLKVIPTMLSKLLTALMKVSFIYKMLIDPMLRSLGSFFKNSIETIQNSLRGRSNRGYKKIRSNKYDKFN